MTSLTKTGQNLFRPSWEEIQVKSLELAVRLGGPGGQWRGIVAVTRGGMVPAAIVARALGIRVIETVAVIGYSDSENAVRMTESAEVIKEAAGVGKGNGWLVIDDLSDTGRTIEVLRRIMPESRFAVLYVKPMGRSMADDFVEEVPQDTWIVFPWESVETI